MKKKKIEQIPQLKSLTVLFYVAFYIRGFLKIWIFKNDTIFLIALQIVHPFKMVLEINNGDAWHIPYHRICSN